MCNAIAFILHIVTFTLPQFRGNRRADFLNTLHTGFVHTDHGVQGILWPFIDLKHGLHLTHEVGVSLCRYTPHPLLPRFYGVFLKPDGYIHERLTPPRSVFSADSPTVEASSATYPQAHRHRPDSPISLRHHRPVSVIALYCVCVSQAPSAIPLSHSARVSVQLFVWKNQPVRRLPNRSSRGHIPLHPPTATLVHVAVVGRFAAPIPKSSSCSHSSSVKLTT